tara:strand:+ start:363 stop:743 length:381 start_codon:yes stop_codon:yes gene_type:complete
MTDTRKVDQDSLENLKQFDEVKLLDCIEQLDYIEKLLAPGPNGEASDLKTQLLHIYQDVEALKLADKPCESEVWDNAIEADETLWAVGSASHKIIMALYELLDCNPKLACQYMGGSEEGDEEGKED